MHVTLKSSTRSIIINWVAFMAAKAKARSVLCNRLLTLSQVFISTFYYRTLIVRLISTAQTGFFYTTQRLRQGPKLSAVKYDPRGMLVPRLFSVVNSCVTARSETESIVCGEQKDEKVIARSGLPQRSKWSVNYKWMLWRWVVWVWRWWFCKRIIIPGLLE